MAICFLCFVNILSNAQAPDWLWAKNAAGTKVEVATSIAVGASGNSVVTGWYYSRTLTFGSIPLTNADTSGYTSDIFVAKYDANGNVLWAKSFGGMNYDEATSVAVDASENIYITGRFSSPTLTFGSTTLTNVGSSDIFVVKYDANGNVIWAKSAGGTSNDKAYSVAVDVSGNSYLTGFFWSTTLNFGTTTLTNSGRTDIFLAKYDMNGNVLWAKSAGETNYDEAYSVAADASGNSYIAGYFYSKTLTFGSTLLTNADTTGNSCDIFLAKYDNNGAVVWAKSANGKMIDEGNSVAVDASGDVYLTGGFGSDTITFGSNILIKVGGYDILLAKYDLNGNVIWVKSAGGTKWENANSVSVNATGDAYIAGCFFSPTLSFGSTTLINADTSSSTPDMFLAKYDANGNVLWAKSAGGIDDDEANSVAVDAAGNTYVAGFFWSPQIAFGSTTLTNSGSEDIFITKSDSIVTGSPELKNSLTISVFPNPFKGKITIINPEKATIEILTIEGQILKTIKNDDLKTTIDLENLPFGIYIIKIFTSQGVMIKKIIKQ